MAKFLRILVGGETLTFSAENIIRTQRTAATTTVITYNHAQATADVLTLTHASDAATAKVVSILDSAIFDLHSNRTRPDCYKVVSLPVAVSTAVLS